MARALSFPLIAMGLLVGGCARTPSASVDARRLDGARPPEVALRCRAGGLASPVTYAWRFSPTAKPVGWNVPANEPNALVQVPDPPGAAWAECTATGGDGVVVRATHALAPARVSGAPTSAHAGELVTVRGNGFGPSRGRDDGLWLVPARGRAQPADVTCKGATWSDAAVSACLPATLAAGAWQLRVQAGGELAIAPAPLVVAAKGGK